MHALCQIKSSASPAWSPSTFARLWTQGETLTCLHFKNAFHSGFDTQWRLEKTILSEGSTPFSLLSILPVAFTNHQCWLFLTTCFFLLSTTSSMSTKSMGVIQNESFQILTYIQNERKSFLSAWPTFTQLVRASALKRFEEINVFQRSSCADRCFAVTLLMDLPAVSFLVNK